MPQDGNGQYAYTDAEDPAERTSIFAPDQDPQVPGEVLVKMTLDAAEQVSAPVPTGRARGSLAAVTRLGVDPLDQAFRDIGVRSVTRLHPPPLPTRAGITSVAQQTDLSASYRVRFDPAQSVSQAVQRLSGLGEVAVAEPNRWREQAAVIPNDPLFAQQWGLKKINCPRAWERSRGSDAITVAVIDTGVDLDHPELAPLLRQGKDFVDLGPDPVAREGWVFEGDFLGVDDLPQDEVGHGTHVAGTISCRSDNREGVSGVTWECRLMPVRVLARIRRLADGVISGVGSAADIAAGIRWAVDHGARVLNLSLGGRVATEVERDAIAHAISRDVVVVAAMGNNFGPVVTFPAAFDDVIAVGATDLLDRKAPFSNTGPHIDVSAPGVNILSTFLDDTFSASDGTSMACPHVAGVAALMLSRDPFLSADDVRTILHTTARPLRRLPTDPVPNNQFGFGLVDADAALAALV
ncbi:S8 family serine peptidase [Streptomyces sp. NPDC014892]|uniref:peptidase S8 n=1 Tax=Streptomyces TaxID=1883 RepID=UPI001EFA7AEC|nr:peptidase S8 [Streptomyces deccanensis]ULR48972.1 S8 family serine peptidase [Streptomyces deccanensis]